MGSDTMTDETMIREAKMWADNTHHLYDSLHKSFLPMLKKKVKNGNYNRDKAKQGLTYFFQQVRKDYEEEFGKGSLGTRIPKADKLRFSELVLQDLEDDGYLPKA